MRSRWGGDSSVNEGIKKITSYIHIDLEVDPRAADALIALGWTPPLSKGAPSKPAEVTNFDDLAQGERKFVSTTTDDVLCHYCDVYVGFAGSIATRAPAEWATTPRWLGTHCWSCQRHIDDVRADPDWSRRTPE